MTTQSEQEVQYALQQLQNHREQCRLNAKKRYAEYKKLKQLFSEEQPKVEELATEEQIVVHLFRKYNKESLRKIGILIFTKI
jgi:predicted nuclease with TOPRIM domain